MEKENKNTTSVNTNSFTKGMVKDFSSAMLPNQNWSHAVNAYNNSVDGDLGLIGNEPANLNCANIPYTIIGFVHKQADEWYVFSTDNNSSEIGYYNESSCEYKAIVNSECLNFKKTNLITGAAKENYDCTWQIYWDDGINPSRTLNVDNIPWVTRAVNSDDCIIYEDTDELDCERLRLAPLVDVPCVNLTKAQDGGLLRNGSYQAYIAYVENEQVVTDYIGISNLQSLFDHNSNSGSLNIEVTNLTKDFEFYQLVILSNNQQNIVAKKIGIYSTEQSFISIDYIDPSLESIPFTVLFARRPAYEKSDAMYVVNDWLIRQGPTEQFDFNYQPIANQISTNWVVVEYPEAYYNKGGNKTNFMRDEVYSFFIRWVYNTGEKSKSYHIPGRPPKLDGVNQYNEVVNEIGISVGANTLGEEEYNFQTYDTSTVISLDTIPIDDGGLVVGRGEMSYWQSTEKYPATQPEIWNSTYTDPETGINIGNTINTTFDLCGKNIRHHKMPTEERSDVLKIYNKDNNAIRLLGVEFSNIERPKFNDGTYIPNIVGYEILRGSREGAKSILAKGVFKNMRKYDVPNNPNVQGLYPNYPYNDLRDDIYFHNGANGEGPANRTDGCDSLEESLNSFKPLSGYTKDVFTFHSPELMFKKPFLNAYEARLYGELNGTSEGYFIASEKHPQFKLLRNLGAILAGIIGVGYAISRVRGNENYKLVGPSAYVDSNPVIAGVATSVPGGKVPSAVAASGTVAAGGVLSGLLLDTLLNDITDLADIFTSTDFSTKLKMQGRFATNSLLSAVPGVNSGYYEEGFIKNHPTGSLPTIISAPLGWLLSRINIADGAQEIIDVIYNFVKFSDFAYKHNSHGELFNYTPTASGTIFRSKIKDINYLGSSYQVFDKDYKVNNLFRPKTVSLSIENEFEDPQVVDKSRYIIGGDIDNTTSEEKFLKEPEVVREKPISMHYGSLKFNFENQYGQLENIKQVPVSNCILEINENNVSTSNIILEGDTYINRYTEKVVMPIFSDFLLGQPNGYNYDYLKRVNIPYPRFWMKTEKYDTTGLANEIITLGFANITDAMPNDLFYLDRGSNSCPGVNLNSVFNNDDPNPAFAMRYAYMYTHVNGVLDFFVESELNLAHRDWEDKQKDRHYDPYEFNNIDDLFHSEVIKEDNFYKYDYSLSKSRFVTNLTSFGSLQARDYDPYVAEFCYNYYPKRLIYSLQAKEEAKKDFWKVYLPNNYRDFKNRITVIKPINKNGAILFFPYQSPQMFQGVDTLQTDLGTKLTIGDGGLFNQPFQNITNADLPNEYGSCESRRTVINTPSGLFFISQAQGKIFQYTDRLTNISNQGMKWWFNKYLPSVLIRQYPELEYHPLNDNPVVGIGCQAIYDINDDIVYFSKRDYAVREEYLEHITFNNNQFVLNSPKLQISIPVELGDPAYFEDTSWTVSYDPKSKAWISFHDWHPELSIPSINHFLTTKTVDLEKPHCPPGYLYNAEKDICEKSVSLTEPAIISIDEVEAIITGGPEDCLVDIIIAMDTSGSTGGPNGGRPGNYPEGTGYAQRLFTRIFVDNLDIRDGMDNGRIQVGFTSWSGNFTIEPTVESMNPNGFSMSSTITGVEVFDWYNDSFFGGTTEIPEALTHAQSVINDKSNSELGDRSGDSNFKQFIILITDTGTAPPFRVGCPFQSATLGGNCDGPDNQFLLPVYVGQYSDQPPSPGVLSSISCNRDQYEFGVNASDTSSTVAIVDAITAEVCGGDYDCNCPEGYTLVYPDVSQNDVSWTLEQGTCQANGEDTYAPICRKIDCGCPPSPVDWATGTTEGECDNLYAAGPNGDPNYVNPNPLTCNYFGLKTVKPSLEGGSIWRHNYRCDLFANFYNVDYPWEIEFVQNSGQQVNTIKNIEYQLETYVYKGDLINGCGDDRWHDLDFNFNEAIIYNSEQSSGLLKLNLNPKNNPFEMIKYPIIESDGIQILYSKEEQKYRFNQFWDITNDRGEFTNSEQKVFITALNGYTKTLNLGNLDYNKPVDQRKKFRHYSNKLILRRTKSDDRKMLLRLSNTKLLMSTR